MDERLFTRALENLVNKALRYSSPGGKIEPAARAAPGPAGGAYLLSVSDDGPGIPTADLPHVFEPFYRGSSSRREQGMGLRFEITMPALGREYAAQATKIRRRLLDGRISYKPGIRPPKSASWAPTSEEASMESPARDLERYELGREPLRGRRPEERHSPMDRLSELKSFPDRTPAAVCLSKPHHAGAIAKGP